MHRAPIIDQRNHYHQNPVSGTREPTGGHLQSTGNELVTYRWPQKSCSTTKSQPSVSSWQLHRGAPFQASLHLTYHWGRARRDGCNPRWGCTPHLPIPAHPPASSIIINRDLATSVLLHWLQREWVNVSSTPRCQSYYAKNLSLVVPLQGSNFPLYHWTIHALSPLSTCWSRALPPVSGVQFRN